MNETASKLPVAVKVLTGSLCEPVAGFSSVGNSAEKSCIDLHNNSGINHLLRDFASELQKALDEISLYEVRVQSCSVLLASNLDDACAALLAHDPAQLHDEPRYALQGCDSESRTPHREEIRLVLVPAYKETDLIAEHLCGTVYTKCRIAELPYTQLLSMLQQRDGNLEKTC